MLTDSGHCRMNDIWNSGCRIFGFCQHSFDYIVACVILITLYCSNVKLCWQWILFLHPIFASVNAIFYSWVIIFFCKKPTQVDKNIQVMSWNICKDEKGRSIWLPSVCGMPCLGMTSVCLSWKCVWERGERERERSLCRGEKSFLRRVIVILARN